MQQGQRTVQAAGAFERRQARDHVSGELIASGIVRLGNGVNYFSPAVILRAAAQISERAPKCDGCEQPKVGCRFEDLVAAVIGRLMEQGEERSMNPASEAETEVDERELVVSKRPGKSLLDRILEGDKEDRAKALDRIDALVDVLDRLRKASIRSTHASDWIVHTARDSEGNITRQVGYLQDCGAERAGKVWGIELSAAAVEREDFADQTFCYHMAAEAWSKVTGERLDEVEGSRWSGDKFFAKQLGPDDKIDPVDVRKSAFANLHGRAVRTLAGLNAVPLEALTAGGIDITKVVHVDYGKGSKGGESTGAGVGTADVVMAWGNAKGQKVAELSEKDLEFYTGAYTRDVADPAKAKFKKANERTLAALKLEAEKRKGAKEQEAAGGTTKAEAKKGERSKRQGALFKRLAKAAGDRPLPVVMRMLSAMCSEGKLEVATLGELTDPIFDEIDGWNDDTLLEKIDIAMER